MVTAQTPAPAQQAPSLRLPPQERNTGMRFREMDQNNDGVITRDEWRGSLQSFRVHDWNRDGVLSGDEVRISARRPVDEEEDFDPETSGQFWNWTPEGFASLDRNRDGRISRSEWPYAMETFGRIDRNRDNVLSRSEFLGGDNPDTYDDDRNDLFDGLDVNNNGRIERSEWHGSDDAFDWLDRDRNGVLSRAEVVGNGGTNTRDAQFASLDYNRNGVITPDEWRWSRGSFDARDLNRDGRLTRSEFNATSDTLRTSAPPINAVTVDARERWTDTGIFVRAGDIVRVNATGTIQMASDPNDIATPAGSRTGRLAPNAPIREALAGGLIAKIGDSDPVFVGDRGSFTAPTSGRLYLGVNDDHLLDNSGEFRVTIDILGR